MRSPGSNHDLVKLGENDEVRVPFGFRSLGVLFVAFVLDHGPFLELEQPQIIE